MASSWITPSPDRTSVRLAQVCSLWRQIFLLNSSLWKHINFRLEKDYTLGNSNIKKEVSPLFFHHAKLGSSSQQSLFILDWDQEVHTHLLQALRTCPVSLDSLEMDLMDDPEGSWDIKAIKAQEVTVYRSNAFRTSRYITTLLRTAHKVTLSGNPPAWGTIPWVALQKLVIREFSAVHEENGSGISFTRDDLSQLLNSAPFLENLELAFEVEETALTWDTSISASHAHLKSLTVHLHHFAGGKGLFGIHLDLPALHTIEFLSIHCRLASAEDDNFIFKSKTLTKLVLPEMEDHEWQISAGLLRWLPNIQRLEMVGRNTNTLLDVARAAYQHLPPLAAPPVSQALTTLHIENTDILGETLLEFVRAKLQHKLAGTEGVSAIECIEMYNTPGVSVTDWKTIQALLEEGRTANSTRSSAELKHENNEAGSN